MPPRIKYKTGGCVGIFGNPSYLISMQPAELGGIEGQSSPAGFIVFSSVILGDFYDVRRDAA